MEAEQANNVSRGENIGEDDEDIPPDFFDDFSKEDFMAGLDIVDDDDWENETSTTKNDSAHADNNVQAGDAKDKKTSNERKTKKIDHVARFRRSPPGRRRKRSRSAKISRSRKSSEKKRSKSSENTSKGKAIDYDEFDIRRDPEKTKRDIQKDKIKRDHDKKQKLITERLKVVETGLVPPGMEMEVDLEEVKSSLRKYREEKSKSSDRVLQDPRDLRNRLRRKSRSQSPVHKSKRDRSKSKSPLQKSKRRDQSRSNSRRRRNDNKKRRSSSVKAANETKASPLKLTDTKDSSKKSSPSRKKSPLIKSTVSKKRSPSKKYTPPRKTSPLRKSPIDLESIRRTRRRSSERIYRPSPAKRLSPSYETGAYGCVPDKYSPPPYRRNRERSYSPAPRRRERRRSRSRSPRRRRTSAERARKSFLQEIADKLNETRPVVPLQMPVTYPIPVPAPVPPPNAQGTFFNAPQQQFDAQFFIGNQPPVGPPHNVAGGAIFPGPGPAPPQVNAQPMFPGPQPSQVRPPLSKPSPVQPPTNQHLPQMPFKPLLSSDLPQPPLGGFFKTGLPNDKQGNILSNNVEKLFEDKKISLSDFLTMAAKPEVHSRSPAELQDKIKVISRCQDAVRILDMEKPSSGKLRIRHIRRKVETCDVPHPSPLRKIQKSRIPYTAIRRQNEDNVIFNRNINNLLQELGMLKEVVDLDINDDSKSSFGDQGVPPLPPPVMMQKINKASSNLMYGTRFLMKMVQTDPVKCEKCDKRDKISYTQTGVQCSREMVSVAIQVCEDDIRAKKQSLASLTPAQLLAKSGDDTNYKGRGGDNFGRFSPPRTNFDNFRFSPPRGNSFQPSFLTGFKPNPQPPPFTANRNPNVNRNQPGFPRPDADRFRY